MNKTLLIGATISACCLSSALIWPAFASDPEVPTAPKAEAAKEPQGLKVGDAIPAVEMQDADGNIVKLADMHAKGPVVLIFYRGGWCPFCTKSLAAWNGRMDEVKQAGATIVAVCLEKPTDVKSTIDEHKLGYTVLSDHTGDGARKFNLMFTLDEETRKKYEQYGIDLAKRNAIGTWELPVPATFVVDQSGVVKYASVDPDYTKRADPDEVMKAVKGLSN